jgi:hypothetical protein
MGDALSHPPEYLASGGCPRRHQEKRETRGDAGGQVDACDGFSGEVLGGEEDQVGGAAIGVVDVGHDVAVVFGGVRA